MDGSRQRTFINKWVFHASEGGKFMHIEIRYYSKSGNTKKLAEAISEVANVPALTVDEPIREETDILFLGSSIYAAGVSSSIKDFIADLDPQKVKKVVNFSTATILTSTYDQVKGLLEEKGIPLAKEEFHCKGSFGLIQKGRPNINDVQDVKSFAKKVIEKSNG